MISIRFLFSILLLSQFLYSQKLTGYIFGAKQEGLAGANIYIENSNSGTISNQEGHFELKIQHGQQNIIFSYVGYQNDTLSLFLTGTENIEKNIALKEYPLQAAAIYVFARQYNDAQEIVSKTIENKIAYLSSLRNYEYDAYHKTIFKIDVSAKQRIIGGLIETKSKGFYQYPDDFQEVVLAKRQSKNFSQLTNVFTVGRVPNLLEETLVFDELSVISPLSMKALDYYIYEMVDTTFFNNRMVFNIAFSPKVSGAPLFTGKMSIIDDDFAVISCSLNGRKNIVTLLRDQITVQQNFRQFEKKYWLPTELRLSSRINMDIPTLPYLYWNQHALISNYGINQANFSHSFDENSLSYQVVSEGDAEKIWTSEQVIPLNRTEIMAMQHIDSVVSNMNPLKKSVVWMMQNFDQFLITGMYDFYHFNRVQGSYLGVGIDTRRKWTDRQFRVRAGYGVADERFSYDLQAVKLLFDERVQTSIRVMRRLDFVDGFYRYNPSDITTQALLRGNDYADYLYREGGEVGIEYRLRPDLRFTVNYESSHQDLAENNLDWNRPTKTRQSYPVTVGAFRTLEFGIGLDNLKYFDYGWLIAPDMSQDFYDFQFLYLKSSKKIWNSKSEFERFYIYFTVFQKAPPWVNFYFRLNSGKLSGNPPHQYYFHLAGAYGSFGNPVLFRTITEDQFLGDRFLVMALENNFKNNMFRLLYLPYLKHSKLDFLVFSNLGWLHSPDFTGNNFNKITIENFPLTEVGFSIGNIFTFFRADFTWRMNYKTGQDFKFNLSSRLFIR